MDFPIYETINYVFQAGVTKLNHSAVLDQLLVAFVGIADVFIIGFVSEAAVSGVSLVNSFNSIFLYLFIALASDGAVVISQYIGKKDFDKAGEAGSQLLLFAVFFGIYLHLGVKGIAYAMCLDWSISNKSCDFSMQGKNFISAVHFSKSRKLDIRETTSSPSVAEKVSSSAPLYKTF